MGTFKLPSYQRLKNFRKSMGWSMDAVSAKTGVKKNVIHRLEKGGGVYSGNYETLINFYCKYGLVEPNSVKCYDTLKNKINRRIIPVLNKIKHRLTVYEYYELKAVFKKMD